MKSGKKGSDKEFKLLQSMPLSELNRNIERCLWGSHNAGTTVGEKAHFKRLLWLEEIRQEIHGIEAPYRDFRKHKNQKNS